MIETEGRLIHKRLGEESVKDLSQDELLLYSIEYFHDSLEKRAEMGAQTAKWTNRVIRSGIIGLMLIATSILLLVVLVSHQMNKIADMMLTLDQHMSIIVTDTRDMTKYVKSMDDSVSSLPLIVNEIAEMQDSVTKINTDMTVISEQMNNSVVLVENIIYNVEGMGSNLKSVAHIVKGMDQNIDTVSRPFSFFNKMVPMP